MRDIIIDIIQIIVGIAFIICLVVGIIIGLKERDQKMWNNGYCECGGHWVYEQAVGHQYGTSYMYKCDSCGKRIEVRNLNNIINKETSNGER